MGEGELGGTVKQIKKNGKIYIAITGAVIGAVLLLFGGNFEGKDVSESSNVSENAEHDNKLDMEEYRIAIEKRVCALCSEVRGVGRVSTVVSLEGGFEYVYATDIKNGVSDSVQYIIIGSGNDEKLVYLTEKVPRISGIGVVCSGGGDISIQNELISLLSAAFDVPSNKIYVTGGG